MNKTQVEGLNQYLDEKTYERDKDFYMEGMRESPEIPKELFEYMLMVYIRKRWLKYCQKN